MTASSDQATICLSSSTKRRIKAEMEAVREAIHALLAADHTATVRQIFYRLTVRGAIEKTEAAYGGTVVRLLTQMRRHGSIPYGWISDNTRWIRKPDTYDGLADFIDQTAAFYRRSLWTQSGCQIEIWSEKDALAGVLIKETAEF